MNQDGLLTGLLITIALTAFPVHALGQLTAQMRPVHGASQASPWNGQIELVLENTGDRPVEVVMEDLPYTVPRSGTIRPMLTVSSHGEEADFTGRIVDFFDKDVATVAIAPGRAMTLRFNVYRSYRLQTGRTYTIAFRSPIRYLDRPSSEFILVSRQDLVAVMKEAQVNPLFVRTPRDPTDR